MMEDTDIASTFEMLANINAEEIPAKEQVPQLSKRAQHSERDQTETGTQNDQLEERSEVPDTSNKAVDAEISPQVQKANESEAIQVTEWFISNL